VTRVTTVLAYDIRNHGTSNAANNGISGIGRWERRDCVGVKKYVGIVLDREHHKTFSRMVTR
jgi:hypothetical protein